MEKKCPLTALKDPCAEYGCAWWIGVTGKDKNTGTEGLQWGCAIPFLVKTSLEQAYASIGVTASLDKMHNAQAKSQLEPALVSIANTMHAAMTKQETNGKLGHVRDARRDDQVAGDG